jgi:hypothetical protein
MRKMAMSDFVSTIAFVSGAKGDKAAASLHPDGVKNVESFAGIEWKF